MKKVFEKKKWVISIVGLLIIWVLVYSCWIIINQIKTKPAGHLIERRSGHHAVLLNDGRIYIVGGDKQAITAEIYDPKTKKSKKVANLPELLYKQEYSVTALNNGKVLIAGGRHALNSVSYIPYSKTAYIYNPDKNIYEPPISMNDYHMEHKAVLLKNGSVILTGGNASSIIDLYNSKLNKFISFGKYCSPLELKTNKYPDLMRQGVISLNNNKVLAVGGGGCNVSNDYSSQAKVIDYQLGKIYSVGSLHVNRGYPEIMLLKDGRALVSGGTNNPQLWVKELEIYDPNKNVFINAGEMDERSGYTATLLPNGKVLFVGGSTGVAQVSRGLTSMYVYDPKDYSYKFLGNLRKIRAGHTATVLKDGSIVFIGSAWDKSIEIYKPTGRE